MAIAVLCLLHTSCPWLMNAAEEAPQELELQVRREVWWAERNCRALGENKRKKISCQLLEQK